MSITPVVVGWFPGPDYERARAMWPKEYDAEFPEYCRRIEAALRTLPYALIRLAPVRVDDYLLWCADRDCDPAESESRMLYAVVVEDLGVPWPPAVGDPCWCRRGLSYGECCAAGQAARDTTVYAAVSAPFRDVCAQAQTADEQYRSSPDLAGIRRRVDIWEQVTRHPEFADASGPVRGRILMHSSLALRERFLHTGDVDDLERGASEFEAGCAEVDPDPQQRMQLLEQLAERLAELYAVTGTDGARDRVIDVLRSLLAAAPAGEASRAEHLAVLARLEADRYEQQPDPAELELVIEHLSDAAGALPEDAALVHLLWLLGRAYEMRFRLRNSRLDLDRSIDSYRRASEVATPEPRQRDAVNSALAAVLRERYAHRGDVEDLTEAIRINRRLIAGGGAESRVFSNNLAVCLRLRFEVLQMPLDLQQAIRILEGLLEVDPGTDHQRSFVLNNLAVALLHRYDQAHDPTDVGRAIDLIVEALSTTPRDTPEWPERLATLALARVRAMEMTVDGDAGLAVADLQRALSATVGPVRHLLLARLAITLATWSERTDDAALDDRAVAVGEDAMGQLAVNAPHRPALLLAVARSLLRRWRRTGSMADLARVLEVLELATEVPENRRSRLPALVAALASARRALYGETKTVEDLQRAIETYRSACSHGERGGLCVRLAAAGDWLEWATARGIRDEAAEAAGRIEELARLLACVHIADHPRLPGAVARLRAALNRTVAQLAIDKRGRDPLPVAEHALTLFSTEARLRARAALRLLGSNCPEASAAYLRAAGDLARLEISSALTDLSPAGLAARGARLASAWERLGDAYVRLGGQADADIPEPAINTVSVGCP